MRNSARVLILLFLSFTIVTIFQNCSDAQFNANGGSVSKTSTDSFQWLSGTWSACSVNCGGGNETRTVSCLNNLGQTVGNSLCSDVVMPAISQSCNMQACLTYNWHASGFGQCSVSCGGGGTQGQTVVCQASNGTTVDDSFCSATPKPPIVATCGSQTCPITCDPWGPGLNTRIPSDSGFVAPTLSFQPDMNSCGNWCASQGTGYADFTPPGPATKNTCMCYIEPLPRAPTFYPNEPGWYTTYCHH
jgi:hypothetical protein